MTTSPPSNVTNRVRAEHVGSLLRPAPVLRARARFAEQVMSLEDLREIEDAAVLEALESQRRAGLGVYTDGEFRRGSWKAHFWEAMAGVAEVEEPDAPRSRWHDVPAGVAEQELRLASMAVTDVLTRKLPLTEVEADFMQKHADGQFKITMPSPSMALDLFRPGVTDAAYATPQEMVDAVIELQVQEAQGLIDRGVRWLQIDSVQFAKFVDVEKREKMQAAGDDPNAAVAELVAFDNALIRGIREASADVTVGVHVCRGNNRSAWIASGGYEPIAEQLFSQVEADRFLLEFDDERSGDFVPLRHVRPEATVVLGLISSKTPVLESQDLLLRRIEEAARYLPMERLALSPQCGFASTAEGNLLSVDDQQRKLELVADTAQKAWG